MHFTGSNVAKRPYDPLEVARQDVRAREAAEQMMLGKKKQNGAPPAAQAAEDAGLQVSKSACALVMATPKVALSLHLGGTAPDAAARAAVHDQLVEFVRALARGAARADHAAERKQALD